VQFDATQIAGFIEGNFKQKVLFVSATGHFKGTFSMGGVGAHITVPMHT